MSLEKDTLEKNNTLESDNKRRVEAFFTAMNNSDSAAIVAAYADDGYVQTMGHTLISGKFTKAQITAAAGAIFESFPQGIRFTIKAMTAEGERVAVEAESDGLHVSGRRYQNEYHFLFQFRNGELVTLKEYMDTERVTDVLCGGQRPAV
jgi:ketosteroid isomerase-like protein